MKNPKHVIPKLLLLGSVVVMPDGRKGVVVGRVPGKALVARPWTQEEPVWFDYDHVVVIMNLDHPR